MASDVGSGEDVRRATDEPSVSRFPASAPQDGAASADGRSPVGRTTTGRPGFFRRHRLPLALAAIALCLYAGSIIYILYGRGQIA